MLHQNEVDEAMHKSRKSKLELPSLKLRSQCRRLRHSAGGTASDVTQIAEQNFNANESCRNLAQLLKKSFRSNKVSLAVLPVTVRERKRLRPNHSSGGELILLLQAPM